MLETWIRTEQIDSGTVVDWEVTLNAEFDKVLMDIETMRRLLREAGYEGRTDAAQA